MQYFKVTLPLCHAICILYMTGDLRSLARVFNLKISHAVYLSGGHGGGVLAIRRGFGGRVPVKKAGCGAEPRESLLCFRFRLKIRQGGTATKSTPDPKQE